MTDKQIIIDEIDVSGCLFFTQYGFCTAQLEILGGSGKCSVNNPNCYYKQLKRKEQECEKKSWEIGNLGYKIKNQRKEINIRLEQLDQLKAKNEELKKLLKVRIEDLCDSCGASSMKLMPCKVYEKTLTEIKEIAENFCSESCPYKDDECDICVEDCLLDEIVNPILQKISEVEDEQE